jgi:hypothetical protein
LDQAISSGHQSAGEVTPNENYNLIKIKSFIEGHKCFNSLDVHAQFIQMVRQARASGISQSNERAISGLADNTCQALLCEIWRYEGR